MAQRPVDLVLLAAAVQQEGFGEAVWEHRFHPVRLWRFDLAWPGLKVAFEREGFGSGFHKLSAHQRPDGYRKDCEKYNAALALGWAVVRGTGRMIEDGTAADDLLAVLNLRKGA
jgi:hypothetical protein